MLLWILNLVSKNIISSIRMMCVCTRTNSHSIIHCSLADCSRGTPERPRNSWNFQAKLFLDTMIQHDPSDEVAKTLESFTPVPLVNTGSLTEINFNLPFITASRTLHVFKRIYSKPLPFLSPSYLRSQNEYVTSLKKTLLSCWLRLLPSSFAHKAIIALDHRDLLNLQDEAAIMHTNQLANRVKTG